MPVGLLGPQQKLVGHLTEGFSKSTCPLNKIADFSHMASQWPGIQMGLPCSCTVWEQMLPWQVSLILLEKPHEAGCRQIISTVRTGERQPTLCTHRGGMAHGHIEGKMTRAGRWGLAVGTELLLLCSVVELIIETFMSLLIKNILMSMFLPGYQAPKLMQIRNMCQKIFLDFN